MSFDSHVFLETEHPNKVKVSLLPSAPASITLSNTSEIFWSICFNRRNFYCWRISFLWDLKNTFWILRSLCNNAKVVVDVRNWRTAAVWAAASTASCQCSPHSPPSTNQPTPLPGIRGPADQSHPLKSLYWEHERVLKDAKLGRVASQGGVHRCLRFAVAAIGGSGSGLEQLPDCSSASNHLGGN